MLASPLLQPESDPPKEGKLVLEKSVDACSNTESTVNSASSGKALKASPDEYVQLQQRIFRVALFVSALAVASSAFFFDSHVSISLLIGALSGVLYLRLLARSIGQLGKSSKSVSKIQLFIPVLLVIAVSKLPELELLPVFFGFFLYKPALIFQFLLESRAKAGTD